MSTWFLKIEIIHQYNHPVHQTEEFHIHITHQVGLLTTSQSQGNRYVRLSLFLLLDVCNSENCYLLTRMYIFASVFVDKENAIL